MLVAHLAEQLDLDFPRGSTIADLRDTLRHVLNLPAHAVARVNGVRVGRHHVVGGCDVVEFGTARGRKGVGKVWTVDEFRQLFGLTERDFQNQIQRGLRVMEVGDGTLRITETAVDDFLRGGVGGDVIATIAASLKRIADHFDPPPPDIVDSTYIADKLGCTKVWVARMATEKQIPPSCIVPGTGFGKPWKFYRSRIDPWILTR